MCRSCETPFSLCLVMAYVDGFQSPVKGNTWLQVTLYSGKPQTMACHEVFTVPSRSWPVHMHRVFQEHFHHKPYGLVPSISREIEPKEVTCA